MRIIGLLAIWFVSVTTARSVPRYATVVSSSCAAKEQYDFIIAGGGVSGLTIADRLTEDPNIKVLVIESGPFDKDEDSVLIPGSFNPAAYLWLPLESTPQVGLNNKTFTAPVGRVVGGGSVVNAMVYMRSSASEYSDWDSIGAEGWTWENMLPYFKKSENFTAPDSNYAAEANISFVPEVHGTDGPVQVSYPNYYFPGSAIWWNSVKSLGFPIITDMNAGHPIGLGWFTTVSDFTNRTRSHARLNHYTRVISTRPNYHILPETTVARVLFNRAKKAVGVQYLPSAGGSLKTALAKKEVLLAAGAVHTPQILQLSGVGPAKILNQFNISVVSDLPGVGQNFHDQPSIILPYNTSNNVWPSIASLDDPDFDAGAREQYLRNKTGPYVLTRGLSTNYLLPTLCNVTSKCHDIIAEARAADPSKYLPADVHPTVLEGYKAQREATLKQLAGTDVAVSMIHWDTADSVRMYFLKPLSRGEINIVSTNPLLPPSINFNTFYDPIDATLAAESFKLNRRIMSQPGMQALGLQEAVPFGEAVATDDDAAIKSALAQVTDPSAAHECCTAAMLPLSKGGVVDPRMRVYGVTSLRVVDVSFWPQTLAAAPTATTYATGERIADIIKAAYGLGSSTY
ncbi:Gmc oxidoreductase [Ceratocystis lukuohia]|uniref:Gmc oxidoreductase n=1 Tax=Ceratocystis lukuohia TaxID=2019550 RepID=A0ABR4MNR9_9PEZI